MVNALGESVIGDNIVGGKLAPAFPDYLGEFSDDSILIGLNSLRIRDKILPEISEPKNH
jgi:hypothetical protein